MDLTETKKIFSLLYPASDIDTSKKFIFDSYASYYEQVLESEKLLLLKSNKVIDLPFIDMREKRMTEEAIKTKKTSYTSDSVNYKINKYGLRVSDKSPLLERNLDIMTFGCSFTYGVGIPIEESWTELVFKNLNFKGLNFGYPGSSITKVIRHIINIVPFFRPKNIAILLPHFCREEIVYREIGKDSMVTHDFIPGYLPTSNDDGGEEAKKFAYSLSFEDRKANVIKNLLLLKYMLQVNNITLYVSSWDRETYFIAKKIFSSKNVLPLFECDVHDTTPWNLGRDGAHPGRKPLKIFANNVTDHILKYYESNKIAYHLNNNE